MTRGQAAIALVVGVLTIAAVVLFARARGDRKDAPCGPGFLRNGPRCMTAGGRCPEPLVTEGAGCDAPDRDRVLIPATKVIVGPSDWEAEGRVKPRTADVAAFAIDRLEVTVGRACASPVFASARSCALASEDRARAVSGVTLAEARVFCAGRGGRLPLEDEWLAAAGGERPRRYPWGDTGAVCRRAVWGLARGPCGDGAHGPDTVGSHPDGATPLGVHDLAGNVAEWVEADVVRRKSADLDPGDGGAVGGAGVVRGGSWKTELATELRTWLRREVPADAKDDTIGFRCAYSGVP